MVVVVVWYGMWGVWAVRMIDYRVRMLCAALRGGSGVGSGSDGTSQTERSVGAFGRRTSRKLVRNAQRPVRVTPIQVPPRIASRPPKMSGLSSQKCAGSVGLYIEGEGVFRGMDGFLCPCQREIDLHFGILSPLLRLRPPDLSSLTAGRTHPC